MFSSLSSKTKHLTTTSLFKPHGGTTTERYQRKRSYDRARQIAQAYNFTLLDVTSLTEMFWTLPADHISVLDASAAILLTIQYNLAAGTLAPFAERRPELQALMAKILNFDVSAQFLLTELAHGLDARHIETTATLLPSGDFDLHTPRFEASKFMPPNGEVEGWDRVGIVIARLIINGDDRGVRPFIVNLSSNGRLCKGVTSRLMPAKPGTESLDHAITTFTHVRLPSSALLGSMEKPTDFRANFMSCIHRVYVGSLHVSLSAIPVVSVSAYIAAKYSMQRRITAYAEGGEAKTIPIWTLRTQQIPILHAFARVAVMKVFASEAISSFKDSSLDPRVRGAISCCVKAFMVQQCQSSLSVLSERCGAQGLFLHNQISSLNLAMQGVAVAEGDTLALSIRVTTDLLLGRYEMPVSRHPDCPLALYERSIFNKCRSLLAEAGTNYKEVFGRRILPFCRPFIEAIAHRMAYEAALDSGAVHEPLLKLYEISVIRLSGAWFASQKELDLSSDRQLEIEEDAVSSAVPFVEKYMEESEAEAYAQAPMLSEKRFREFADGLEIMSGGTELASTSLDVSDHHLAARL